MHAGSIALVVLLVIIGVIWVKLTTTREQRMVEKGLGKYVVKVAGSGKGKTFHALHCNRCTGATIMTVAQAQQSGYNRCKFCGGTPTFKRS